MSLIIGVFCGYFIPQNACFNPRFYPLGTRGELESPAKAPARAQKNWGCVAVGDAGATALHANSPAGAGVRAGVFR